MVRKEMVGGESGRGGGGGLYSGYNKILYLGPEAMGAHSEQGWTWSGCTLPEDICAL